MADKTITIQEQAMMPLFEAMNDSVLKSRQRLLLIVIWGFMIERLECVCSYENLMAATKMSKKAIMTATDALIADGWITVVYGDKKTGTDNFYKLVLSRLGLEEVKQGQLKKVDKSAMEYCDMS